MLLQGESTIFLAEKRKPTPTGFENTIGNLVCKDTILTGSQCMNSELKPGFTLVLIPYIGDLQVNHQLLEENQAFISGQSGVYQVCNPYASEGINFFELLIPHTQIPVAAHTISIDIASQPNQWISMGNGISIGQWNARLDGTYTPEKAKSNLFIFVIAGAFEVQNRLLQPRDSLQIAQVELLELEALSPDAILLIIEM